MPTLPYSSITNPGTDGVNYVTGERGLLFQNTSGATVTITEVGRWVMSGNNQIHTVSVYAPGSSTVIQSVAINLSGATANQFKYGTLPTPVDVAPGGAVYILSDEVAGADWFWNVTGQVNVPEDVGYILPGSRSGGLPSYVAGQTTWSYGPVSFKYTAPIRTWVKGGNVYTTDGSQYQVYSALRVATSGDRVDVPAGSFSWGSGAASMTIPAGVTLQGAGMGSTIITMVSGAPAGYGSGLILLNNNSVAKGLEINGNTARCVAFTQASSSAVDWRISYCKFTPGTSSDEAYLLYNSFTECACRGLIDNCYVTLMYGQSETIFTRGPATAWDSASGVGDLNAIYVENCTFAGSAGGYVCDANANGSIVVRFCTITGPIKIDGHGLTTNTPNQGYRRIEAYNNTWTYSGGSWHAMELRGGTNYIFNNTGAGGAGKIQITDYSITGAYAAFGSQFMTPNNYPIGYQAGSGARVTKTATQITAGMMCRIVTPNSPSFTSIGAADNNVGTQFVATGTTTGSGTVTTTPATEPNYIWGNINNGSSWPRTVGDAAAGAQTLYGSYFSDREIIQKDRDVFASTGFDGTYTFDGSKGVGTGTAAAMAAIASNGITKLVGAGFWVTDEGSWNTEDATVGAPGYGKGKGRLYTWNGSAFALKYEPAQYPHPLRSADAGAVASARLVNSQRLPRNSMVR